MRKILDWVNGVIGLWRRPGECPLCGGRECLRENADGVLCDTMGGHVWLSWRGLARYVWLRMRGHRIIEV